MLQGFKEHLGNWLKDGFYFNKNRCDPVHIARTARFTRNANQFLHIPDCFNNEGILKLYNLRCEDSEFFGQDGYIRYDTVCLRCRGEKWTIYHPSELQVPENPLMLQPTSRRRMRSCIPNIWRWLRNIGRKRRGVIPKRGKKDDLAIRKSMWKQPWMYWDSDKRMCRADDEAYGDEHRQQLLKDLDEKKEFCTKYDDEKKAEAAWQDRKMAARAELWNTFIGRIKYRTLWWPPTFFHWLKRKGIHVGGWFKRVEKKTEANMAKKCCNSQKEDKDSAKSRSRLSFLLPFFCCSKKRISDEEAAIPEETVDTPPKKISDATVDDTAQPAEETASTSDGQSAEAAEEPPHKPVENNAEIDAATDNNDGNRGISAQTLVSPAEGTESCNSTTTTALGDESSGAEQDNIDESRNGRSNGTKNKRKVDRSTEMAEPCFDVFTDLDRFDQLKDIVAFMKHPSGELVKREDWSWETLGKLKAVHAIYPKPPQKEMGFRWKMKWYLCAVMWPFKGRIRYIDDQADYLQLDAFIV